MKLWISISILLLAVVGLCVWDTVYTTKVFNTMDTECEEIYSALLESDISNEDIQTKIMNLNDFWTQKMDILSISISRKDLQPISDYLQYLYSSIHNNSQDDAITYSRLLHYNVMGLKETVGISAINLI